jgi:hypothetical protein
LDNESHGNNVDFEGPIGRKAEKAERKRKEGPSEEAVELIKKKVESLEDARVQGEEFIRLEKEKFQLQKLDLKEKINIEKRKLHLQELDCKERIMMLDTSGMSEFQQQYWMAGQKEIVEIHESRKLAFLYSFCCLIILVLNFNVKSLYMCTFDLVLDFNVQSLCVHF